MSKMKEQNDKIVNAIIKLLEKVQEERDGERVNTSSSSNTGRKRKGVCFICQVQDHYAPDCQIKKVKKPEESYYKRENQGGSYYQRGNQGGSYYKRENLGGPYHNQENQAIAQRKQNSNCYHCGEAGHWASQCPIKDIPSFDPEFWNDLDNFVDLEPKKLHIEEPQQSLEERQPLEEQPPQPQQVNKGGKKEPKRKLFLEKKGKEISE